MRIPRTPRHPGLVLGAIVAATAIPTLPLAANPSWKGRPFVKVLAQLDPIPGADGSVFTTLERFTLRDGKLHIVAGESANRKGLFRWHQGLLTRLVYTDTQAPTGGKFDTVFFTTDETDGALNFAGEVRFGRPGAISGLFEWRDGVITTVFDGAREVDGKVLLGLGYPVRVGHEVAGATQFLEAGALKNGIFRWNGTTLRTVVQTGDELPGSLGGFTGHPGRYQIAFDGQSVGFVASAHPQGLGPYGVYRAGPDGTLTKLVDGTDPFPWGGTYATSGLEFVNVDLDGANTFVGVGDIVSASGTGNSFYFGPQRITGGTLSSTVAPWGSDGTQEEVLPFYEPGSTPPVRATLDGKIWTAIRQVDGHGDDVAFLVTFDDFTEAIYAAIGDTVSPPTTPVLAAPTLANGRVTLRFGSVAGAGYRVEFRSALGGPGWDSRGELSGTGAALEFSEAIEAAGFYRVTVLP
ncbi:MAG: hypothetical protein J0L84_00745 [Verrucomicrobia bacterium]|nr:hypothetical protein [Verrucomicrobiota bacterium]